MTLKVIDNTEINSRYIEKIWISTLRFKNILNCFRHRVLSRIYLLEWLGKFHLEDCCGALTGKSRGCGTQGGEVVHDSKMTLDCTFIRLHF